MEILGRTAVVKNGRGQVDEYMHIENAEAKRLACRKTRYVSCRYEEYRCVYKTWAFALLLRVYRKLSAAVSPGEWLSQNPQCIAKGLFVVGAALLPCSSTEDLVVPVYAKQFHTRRCIGAYSSEHSNITGLVRTCVNIHAKLIYGHFSGQWH